MKQSLTLDGDQQDLNTVAGVLAVLDQATKSGTADTVPEYIGKIASTFESIVKSNVISALGDVGEALCGECVSDPVAAAIVREVFFLVGNWLQDAVEIWDTQRNKPTWSMLSKHLGSIASFAVQILARETDSTVKVDVRAGNAELRLQRTLTDPLMQLHCRQLNFSCAGQKYMLQKMDLGYLSPSAHRSGSHRSHPRSQPCRASRSSSTWQICFVSSLL